MDFLIYFQALNPGLTKTVLPEVSQNVAAVITVYHIISAELLEIKRIVIGVLIQCLKLACLGGYVLYFLACVQPKTVAPIWSTE